jgi:NAD(P)-dependent dehydrogenase (short-subunit alcohol dehydrogenase family)
MTDVPVALVTGASRGIGKAIAVHLAAAGHDVAIGARTVHEGEEREHSSTLARSDTRPLPGSLDATGALIEEAGARVLPVYLDLLDRASLTAAVGAVIEEFGRIDVLVNNGRYVGPGHMDQVLDTPVDLLDRHLEANVMAPIILAKLVLPQMVERGRGVVINLASSSGTMDPPKPAGHGGWGLGYGMSKGALHRLAGILALELGDRGIRSYQSEPRVHRHRADRHRHGRIRIRRQRRRPC